MVDVVDVGVVIVGLVIGVVIVGLCIIGLCIIELRIIVRRCHQLFGEEFNGIEGRRGVDVEGASVGAEEGGVEGVDLLVDLEEEGVEVDSFYFVRGNVVVVIVFVVGVVVVVVVIVVGVDGLEKGVEEEGFSGSYGTVEVESSRDGDGRSRWWGWWKW